jgi:hypothetical protein
MHKGESMCPAAYCRETNPVQALIDHGHAERMGHPELGGGVHCTGCGTVWFTEGESKRIVGRFAGPINALGWMPSRPKAAPRAKDD